MQDFANMYDVVYTRDGKLEYYARGLSLDRAQAIKTSLTNAGYIVLFRTGSDGFQGGTTQNATISNVRVVRSYTTGTDFYNTTEYTEVLTVATSGQRLFQLTYSPIVSGNNLTITVNASAGRPDVIFSLVSLKGTPMVEIASPVLATTDTVSATYRTWSDTRTVSVTANTVESPNSSRTTYTVTHVYRPGSVTVTSSVSGAVRVYEGGGNTFEVLNTDGTAVATGTTLSVVYTYSGDDDTAIPASEAYTLTYPNWVGQAIHPPFTAVGA